MSKTIISNHLSSTCWWQINTFCKPQKYLMKRKPPYFKANEFFSYWNGGGCHLQKKYYYCRFPFTVRRYLTILPFQQLKNLLVFGFPNNIGKVCKMRKHRSNLSKAVAQFKSLFSAWKVALQITMPCWKLAKQCQTKVALKCQTDKSKCQSWPWICRWKPC